MRKVALLLIATAFIAGCSVKGKQEMMTPDEAKQIEKVAKINPEQYVDVEKLQEERSGMAELKKKAVGIAKGLTIGTVVRNPTLAQAIDIATSVVIAKGFEKIVYKDTAAVIPIYENPNLISKDCKFQLQLRFRNKKQKEHWNRKFYVVGSFSGYMWGYKLHGINLSHKPYKSKIILYFVEFDNPRWIPLIREAYPFIHALADIVIDGKLAGRYVLYGEATRAIAKWKNGDMKSLYYHIKDFCRTEKQAKNETR